MDVPLWFVNDLYRPQFSRLRKMEGVQTNKRKLIEIDAPPPPELEENFTSLVSNIEKHRRLNNKATPEYARQLRRDIKKKNIQDVRIILDKRGAHMTPSIDVTITRHLPAEKYQALIDTVFKDTIKGGARQDGGLMKVGYNPSRLSDALMAEDEEREKQKEKDKLSSQRQRDIHFAQGKGTLSRKDWNKEKKGGVKVCFKDDMYEVTCLDVAGERLFELYVEDQLEQTSSEPRFLLDKDYAGKCIMVVVCTRTNGIEATPSNSPEVIVGAPSY